jgi:hypothetical protein
MDDLLARISANNSLTDDLRPFHTLMLERLDATLAEYLSAVREAIARPGDGRVGAG